MQGQTLTVVVVAFICLNRFTYTVVAVKRWSWVRACSRSCPESSFTVTLTPSFPFTPVAIIPFNLNIQIIIIIKLLHGFTLARYIKAFHGFRFCIQTIFIVEPRTQPISCFQSSHAITHGPFSPRFSDS